MEYYQVEPILEILVRKSLEEARKELITEKESTEIELLKVKIINYYLIYSYL